MRRRHIIQNNDDMKFIGLDGFEEIESLFPEKKSAAPLKAKAPKAKQSIFGGRMKTAKAIKESRRKRKAAENAAKPRRGMKKKAAFAVAASVTAIMFSFSTMASALESDAQSVTYEVKSLSTCRHHDYEEPVELNSWDDVDEDFESEQVENTAYEYEDCDNESCESDEDEYADYYALYINDGLMGVIEADDLDALKQSLNNILEEAKKDYVGDSTVAAFENSVEIKPYNDYVSYTDTVDELMEDCDGMFSVRVETKWYGRMVVPYETDVVSDDSLPEGYKETVQTGQDGVTRVTTRVTFVDGEKVDEVLTDEDVESEPVKATVLVGANTEADAIVPGEYEETETTDTTS